MKTTILRWTFRGLVLTVACAASGVMAQEAVKSVPGESGGRRSSRMPPGAVAAPGGGPGQPGVPGAAPDGKGAPVEPEKKPDKPEPPKGIARPDKPTTPPNRDEFKVRPDKNGRIKFNFQGQPWTEVLMWLATISNLSLDWQEMPPGYLNLRTQRSYTVEETRDMLNQHLLERGYTMLKSGETLFVVSFKKLDPSMVPRVSPADLDEHPAHEFVKVAFPLDSLMAENANEELKPLLSPNGRISALKKTNRIEVMDSVTNLLEIRNVLEAEQSKKGGQKRVREFKLTYVRAADLKLQLQDLLGQERAADPNAGQANMNPMQQMMMQQQRMQMMQQQGQQGGAAAAANKPPPVFIIAVPRENSLIVHAPADQLATIESMVKLLDIPSSRNKGEGLMQQVGRIRVHRLAALDPEPLIKMLEDVGDLDPSTKLTADKKNRAVIVDAPLSDHFTISTLIKKLDGTDRKFEVVKLRRLSADYVAGSIEFMMGGVDKKKNNRQSTYDMMFGYGYGYGGYGRQNEEDDSKKFRVDADVENNRLLLWTNEVELEEINRLLVKLGELPDPSGNGPRTRVLEAMTPEENKQLLDRFRRVWPNIGKNPLQIDPRLNPVPEKEARETPDTASPPARKPRLLPPVTPPEKTTRQEERRPQPVLKQQPLEFAQAEATEEAPARREAVAPDRPVEKEDPAAEVNPLIPGRRSSLTPSHGKNAPPIRIERGIDGQLMISSDDVDALDRAQDVLTEMAPPRRDYKIFKMKHRTTFCVWIADNLKDYFEEKEKDKNRWGGYWEGVFNAANKTDDRRLSKRKPLKFIADIDSNTVLVRGADPHQLRIIEELIKEWDLPESADSKTVRKTKVIQVHHSKARVIADALKDVYRDLLSANDPALANQNNNKDQKRSPESTYTVIYNSGGDDKKPDAPMKFKGMLSIGVDELSNMLVISAVEGLMENVEQTVKILDQAAKSTVPRFQVVQVNRNVNAGELQKKLKSLMPKPAPQQPQQPKHQQQQQPVQPQGGPSETTIVNE